MTYTVKATTGFAPLLTPRYDLTDADFLFEKDTDPVTVERVDLYSLPSIQRDRSHQPLQRLCGDPDRGARPGADRNVWAARRLDRHRP